MSCDWKCIGKRHWSARDDRREILALDEFHDECTPVLSVEAENLGDVRVIERSECLCFAREPGEPLRVRRKELGQDFDRDVSVQTRIAAPIDFTHPSDTKQGLDFIGADTRAAREGHVGTRIVASRGRSVGADRHQLQAPQ